MWVGCERLFHVYADYFSYRLAQNIFILENDLFKI